MVNQNKNKRGGIFNRAVIHLILIGIIFALFLFATAGKVNGRGVRQQVLEKQTALLIDSAVPGMSFEISKDNFEGSIQDVEIKNGKVFITVAGLKSFDGYPYFSKYSVSVVEEENKFIIFVK